jgi:hypothetical protein
MYITLGDFTLPNHFSKLIETLTAVQNRRKGTPHQPTERQALHQSGGQSQPADGMARAWQPYEPTFMMAMEPGISNRKAASRGRL